MPLTITEARKNLSDLVKRAEYGHEETVIGPRGKRSAVIVGAEDLADLRRRLEQAEQELTRMRTRRAALTTRRERSTWSTVREAVAQFEAAEPRTHARRFLPGLQSHSPLSREERVRIGRRGEEEPEFRRVPPGSE